MGMHEHFASPPPSGRTPSPAVAPATGKSRKKRRGCGAAARKRARLYVAKRRLPQGLWPILVALFFLAIVFGRQNGPVQTNAPTRNRRARTAARSPQIGPEKEASTLPCETGAALNGEAALEYHPPVDFQARRAAEIVAFLIRNRGRLDTDVVRAKWKHLDLFSLPLAVYLRDIEANGDWSELKNKIAASPLLVEPKPSRPDVPSSIRHRKILELIPEWARRGEELLASLDAEEPAPAASSDCHPDDNETPPKPTRT